MAMLVGVTVPMAGLVGATGPSQSMRGVDARLALQVAGVAAESGWGGRGAPVAAAAPGAATSKPNARASRPPSDAGRDRRERIMMDLRKPGARLLHRNGR